MRDYRENSVSDVIDAYNELMTNVDKEIAKGGNLQDQTTLKWIRNQLRNLMTSSVAGENVYKNLDSIGISLKTATAGDISTSGLDTLSFDKNKFVTALQVDTTAMKKLLVGNDSTKGVLSQVESVLETSINNYFMSAEKSYSNKISDLNSKIEKANKSVEVYRARLEAKFAAMDLLISKMQQQYSSFLTTPMSNI